MPAGIAVAAAVRDIQMDPAVEFAEPNWIHIHQATSNDTYFTSGQLWGMYGDATAPANPFGSQAGEAWARGNVGSSSVYIGVIDEGIQFTHPELQANVWNNPFDPVDGFDNDGTATSTTRTGGISTATITIYDGGKKDGRRPRHARQRHDRRQGTAPAGRRNWNVTLISGKFLAPAARPPTRSRRCATSPI